MRISFIDNSKAIALLLVIIGHTDGLSQNAENFIYAFHMPAFFLISGYLLKDYKLNLSFKDFLLFQMKSLLVPFLFFAFISFCYSLFNSYVKGDQLDIMSKLSGVLVGTAESLTINTVLWFLTCLFSTSTLFFALSKKLSINRIITFSFISFFTIHYCKLKYVSINIPWNIDIAFSVLLFYALGKYFADKISYEKILKINKKLLYLLIIPIFVLLYYTSNLNGRIDVAYMEFKNPFLYLFNACLGIVILFAVGVLLPSSSFLRFVSNNTIILFPIHPIIFSIFTGVGMMIFKLPHSFQDNLVFSFLYLIGALVIGYPASLIINKLFPIFIGKGNRK